MNLCKLRVKPQQFFGARYYDSDLSSWLSVDPLAAARPNLSPYNYCQNNPVVRVDPTGMLDDIVVTTKKGKELFRLDDGKTEITTMTASELYGKGIQWFEPTADNYMPLISVSLNIKNFEEILHFKWHDITTFATKDRNMFSYYKGNSGDWKAEGNPGNGYLMVEVEGMPYWADAIGQLPFAINCFKNELESTKGNVDLARKATISTGQKWGSGTLFGKSDNTNSYDNVMIKRGINRAKNYYYYNER